MGTVSNKDVLDPISSPGAIPAPIARYGCLTRQSQPVASPPVARPDSLAAAEHAARGAFRRPRARRPGADPHSELCQIAFETHDEKYCGHFLLRRADFTPHKLSIELDRPRDNFVSVTFAMVVTGLASQMVKTISGEIEPP
jgi:hypothetical protein